MERRRAVVFRRNRPTTVAHGPSQTLAGSIQLVSPFLLDRGVELGFSKPITTTVVVATGGGTITTLGTTPETLLVGLETLTAGAAVVAFNSMPPSPTATAVPLLRVVTPVRSTEAALVTALQFALFHSSTSVPPTAQISLAEEPEMADNWPLTVVTSVQLVPWKFQMADPPTTQTSVAERLRRSVYHR